MKPIIAVPATLLLVYRAYSRKSLTPFGIAVAAATAAVHAAHPSPAPFAFLVVFFLGGTRVTRVKHDIKARLTVSSMGGGSSGGEGPRTHVQVLANAGVAVVLVLVDVWRRWRGGEQACLGPGGGLGSLLLVGITANYAAVAADTYSSELGILAKSSPRLIASPLRKVPPGTNGGVTVEGIAAGALGAFTIAATSLLTLPFCADSWTWQRKALWTLGVVVCGTTGSILDSVLGALLQSTVIDKRTGKVVEEAGGRKVLVHPGSVTATPHGDVSIRRGSQLHMIEEFANTVTPKQTRIEHDPKVGVKKAGEDHESRKVIAGSNILDNNDVNFLMAALTTGLGMFAASYIF